MAVGPACRSEDSPLTGADFPADRPSVWRLAQRPSRGRAPRASSDTVFPLRVRQRVRIALKGGAVVVADPGPRPDGLSSLSDRSQPPPPDPLQPDPPDGLRRDPRGGSPGAAGPWVAPLGGPGSGT